MLSLEQLRKPLTRAQAMERIVELLTAFGFDTTAWQEGAIQRTLMNLLAVLVSDFSEVSKAGAEFGFNAYATGDALREFSRSRYQQDKQLASRTRGTMRLTSTASIPYTIVPGQLLATTESGVQFRNVTGGVLSAGSVSTPSTLDLVFDAVIAGAASAQVANGAVNRLITPLAGVTISNNLSTPWYSVAGADEESDVSMRRRNATKWATLTVEFVAESYEHIARQNGAAKVKVHDSNPRGAGTLDVYAAGETAQLGNATMAAIQAAFAARAFQTDAAWPSASDSRVATVHPTPHLLNITATLYHDPNVPGATMVSRAREALTDYLRRTPIGGWDYSPGPANVLKYEDIADVLKNVEGMRSVTLGTPSSSVTINPLALVTEGAWSLTPVAVTA